MIGLRVLFIATALLTFPGLSFGNEPDKNFERGVAQQAIGQTKQMLTDPTERAKYLKTDAKAMKQDEKVKELLGSQSENAYEIASQLTTTIFDKAGGDPKKMEEMVNALVLDPKSLDKLLTPAQREAIRSIAGEVEAKNKGKLAAPERKH